MSKRVLVIGGTGFIGKILTEKLISKGYNVTMVEHKTPIQTKNTNIIKGGLERVNLDILKEFDIVFHLGRMSAKNSLVRLIKSILGYIINARIIRSFHNIENKPKLVFFSGSLVYGFRREAYENTQLKPISYQRFYFLQEMPFLREIKSLPIYIFRLPWVWGYGSWLKSFFIDKTKYGYVPMYLDGNNTMTIIDVEDCVNLVLEIVNNCEPDIYNITSPITIKQKDLCCAISEYLKLPIKKFGSISVIIRYGFETYEAFKFSLKLETLHESIYRTYKFKYSDFQTLFFEYIKTIFAESP